MNLVTRLWQNMSARGSGLAYQQLLARPDHHLVTVLLSRALEQKADAICFGFRQEIIEEPCHCDQCACAPPSNGGCLPDTTGSDYDVVRNSAMTRGPMGDEGLPISFRVGGILRRFSNWPCHSYGMILAAIQSRAVAIGANSTDHQPLRYIEIGYGMSKHPTCSHPSGKRRLVEVDLEYQADNTFWIYLRTVREVESDITVSQSVTGD
jgi:hypothetical protein